MSSITIWQDEQSGGVLELLSGGTIERQYLADALVLDTSTNGAARPKVLAATPEARVMFKSLTEPVYHWIDLNLRKSGEWSLPRDMTLDLVTETSCLLLEGVRVVIYAVTPTSNGAVLAAMVVNELLEGIEDPIAIVRGMLGERAVETKVQAELIYNFMDVSSDLRTSFGFYDKAGQNAAKSKTASEAHAKQLPAPGETTWKCSKCGTLYKDGETLAFESTKYITTCPDSACQGVCAKVYDGGNLTSTASNRSSGYVKSGQLWVCSTCFCEFEYSELDVVHLGGTAHEDWAECMTKECNGKCKPIAISYVVQAVPA